MYLNFLASILLICLLVIIKPVLAIEFNSDILDLDDRDNIDLSLFSKSNYIIPGEYSLNMKVNGDDYGEKYIVFYSLDDEEESQACITKEIMSEWDLNKLAYDKINIEKQSKCIDLSALSGVTVKGDLPSSSLQVSIPQAWLNYTDSSWSSPSTWDDGINGVIWDYNLLVDYRKPQNGYESWVASSYGTTGVNIGTWRLRGDYQASYEDQKQMNTSDFRYDRLYAYRALPHYQSKLSLGELDLNSDLIDSFRYTGLMLASDESMLPPNLRGYAPEVSGVAKTNAKVSISQNGRKIYETNVASGPFRIQDLNSTVHGLLDVKVVEEDGSTQEYQVNTASIPYLTRPGRVRYKAYAGRLSNNDHDVYGPSFVGGEFSLGLSNAWSIYSGGIIGDGYQALNMGMGRDLFYLGAISADVTQSLAEIDGSHVSGMSFRINYAKRFDEYDSEISFAGYRFSDDTFMNMNEYSSYLDGSNILNDKQMYTISVNKTFNELGLSSYLSYSYRTYWDSEPEERYSVSFNKYFDTKKIKNISTSLTFNQTQYDYGDDNSIFLSITMPLGLGESVSYSGQFSDGSGQTATFNKILDKSSSYRVSVGEQNNNAKISSFYQQKLDSTDFNLTASYMDNNYQTAGIALHGGMTMTLQGGAAHRSSVPGGTRLLIDTTGVEDVPLNNGNAVSNQMGYAVLTDVSSYYKNSVGIDLNNLPDTVEVKDNLIDLSLTEGAIGYRKFYMIEGKQLFSEIKLENGDYPPFGSSIRDEYDNELGIVSEKGRAYLIGINSGRKIEVFFGEIKCDIYIPEKINDDEILPLTCVYK